MDHDEIRSLLGAYALDAVDPDERTEVERHLVGCPQCRAEVAEHREAVAWLARSGSAAPEGVWDRIAAAIDVELPPAITAPPAVAPPAPPLAPVRPQPSGRRRWMAATAGVVAAAAAVIGFLAVKVVDQGRRLDELQAALAPGDDAVLARAAGQAATRPGSRHALLVSADGTMQVPAVVTPEGVGFLLDLGAMPALPAGRTYQLWGVVDGAVLSLGVLGADPGMAVFQVDGPLQALVLTEEASPGVAASQQPALVQGTLS